MRREAGVGIEVRDSYGASHWAGSDVTHADETVAEDVPVALAHKGIAHPVMFATPLGLEDFALGVSLSECIVGRPAGDRFGGDACPSCPGECYWVYSHPQRVH